MLPIEGADYFIRLKILPPKIFAFVRSNGDGTYTIYLDPRRDFEHKIDDYTHELWHILNDDIYNGRPLYVVESIA